MNNKEFFNLVKSLKKLEDAPKSLKNRFRIWSVRRQINRLIKQAARAQAEVAYNQTVKVFNDILDKNLEN